MAGGKPQTGTDINERLLKEDSELVKRAKFSHELVVEILGDVSEIKGYSKLNRVRVGELRIGGRNEVSEAGYQNHLEISLRLPAGQKVPREILFHGNSPLFTGDFVHVGIFAGKKEYLSFFDTKIKDPRILTETERDFERVRRYVLVPRELNEREEALYLKIIRNGREARTDFCVDYNPEKLGED